MRTIRWAAAALCFLSAEAEAQKASITGVVVSSEGVPIAGADVSASAENARAISDSAGRFEIRNLPGGTYTVRARKLGYLATRMTADVSNEGRATLRIELKVRPPMLDSVVIVAKGNCPEFSYVGFICRRKTGKGVYFTDDDIFDKNAREIGDIFRDVPGFRIEMQPTPWGRLPVPQSTRASSCLNALVNGRVAAPANPIPRFADEMVAVEIYASPSDVPDEYQRYVWGRQGRQTQLYHDRNSSVGGERCSLVVYWTVLG